MKINGNAHILGFAQGAFESHEDFPENPKVGTWAFIHKSLMICVEVDDVPVWYPLTQERNTFVFSQETPAERWQVTHNFLSENVMVQCFDSNGAVVLPTSINVVDETVIEVVFPEAIAGKAIAIYGKETGVGARGAIAGGGEGGIPVGGILAFTKIPSAESGYLPCTGFPYSKLEYPDLFDHLQVEETPNFTDRYLKMIGDELSPLQTVAWKIPEHTHETDIAHNHSASFKGNALPNHAHGYSMVNTSAHKDSSKDTRPTDPDVLLVSSKSLNTSGASAGTPSGEVKINALGSTKKVSSGIREALNKGSRVEVDHVGVVYCIKATNGMSPRGLAELGQVKSDIAEVKAKVDGAKSAFFYGQLDTPEGFVSGVSLAASGVKQFPVVKKFAHNTELVDSKVKILVSGMYKLKAKVLISSPDTGVNLYTSEDVTGSCGYAHGGLYLDTHASHTEYFEAGSLVCPVLVIGEETACTLWSGMHTYYSVELVQAS